MNNDNPAAKSRNGGARPGAGRPRKTLPLDQAAAAFAAALSANGGVMTLPPPPPPPSPTAQPGITTLDAQYNDPLVFLKAVWRGDIVVSPLQLDAAKSALPYMHKKLGEGGKKEEKEAAAQKAHGQRFGAAQPPLRAVGGKG